MKKMKLFGLAFLCVCFAAPGYAKKKTVAFCHELKIPQDIDENGLVWQVVKEFHLDIQKRNKSLSARGGWDEASVEVTGDELVVTQVDKENALNVLTQLTLSNQETGQVYRLFDVNQDNLAGAVHYNIGKTMNQQDASGMELFVFVDSKGQALAKMIRVGWVQAICGK